MALSTAIAVSSSVAYALLVLHPGCARYKAVPMRLALVAPIVTSCLSAPYAVPATMVRTKIRYCRQEGSGIA